MPQGCRSRRCRKRTRRSPGLELTATTKDAAIPMRMQRCTQNDPGWYVYGSTGNSRKNGPREDVGRARTQSKEDQGGSEHNEEAHQREHQEFRRHHAAIQRRHHAAIQRRKHAAIQRRNQQEPERQHEQTDFNAQPL